MRSALSSVDNPYTRSACVLGAALAIAWAGNAIFPDTAHGQDAAPVNLAGVWSTAGLDTFANPGWDIVGLFSCRCATETYAYLNAILYDPAKDDMSAEDIIDALEAHTLDVIAGRLTETGHAVGAAFDLADDPAIQCERFGAFRTVLHSDPIAFEIHDDRIVIKGEDLTVDRTIFMDGRGHPENQEKSPIGHSIGWYEGRSLVVETVGVSPGLVDDQLAVHNSDQARSVERYTLSPDGRRLDVDFTLYDPVMLEEPLTIRRPRVRTPEVELQKPPCSAIAGQF